VQLAARRPPARSVRTNSNHDATAKKRRRNGVAMKVTIDFLGLFNKVIAVVFGVMLLFITLGIIAGVVQLVIDSVELVTHEGIVHQYHKIISDVLTMFILIELSRSLVEYFNTNRLRMTFIVDAGIVFVLRELMIKLFEHKAETADIYALSVLLLVLGALRIGSVLVYQREKKMFPDDRDSSAAG
jgi:uncharacterized membrane protein (DUF373 family)